jgi:hypothetical protein
MRRGAPQSKPGHFAEKKISCLYQISKNGSSFFQPVVWQQYRMCYHKKGPEKISGYWAGEERKRLSKIKKKKSFTI